MSEQRLTPPEHRHAIKVKVIGSAAADRGFGGPGARSFSADYVTILPLGWRAA